MTTISTDNPIIAWRIWMLDLMWQYWYVTLVLIIISVLIVARHFDKRQREWNAYMDNLRKESEDFRQKCNISRTTKSEHHKRINENKINLYAHHKPRRK